MPDIMDPVTRRQIAVINKIIQDETWLEGERRKEPVSPKDPAVRAKVCEIVLRIGQDLRNAFTVEAQSASSCGRMGTDP